jgi:hypothetical protein
MLGRSPLTLVLWLSVSLFAARTRMNHLWSFVLLCLLPILPAQATADGYEPPSPSSLQSIQAQHGRKDWWFITTDSTRFLVRIRRIDTRGLSGLKPKRASEPAPDAIGWSSIARIDERHSKFLAKSIQGVFLGALIGGTLPFMINQTRGGDHAGWTLLAGAVSGGWLGGLWGDHIAREDPIYVSRTLITPQPVPLAPRPAQSADSTLAAGTLGAATSSRPGPGSATGVDSTVAPGAEAPSPNPSTSAVTFPSASAGDTTAESNPVSGPGAIAIAEACREIHPADRLRIHADFGIFDGQAERASIDGLSGLRPHSAHGDAESIPGLVTWDRIQRIDRAGNAAASGARKGAVVFGALGAMGGLFAIAVASAAGSSSTEPGGSWIVIGAAGGAAGGALLGAAIGSGGQSWRPIYIR